VLPAISFNDQTMLDADEIEHERAERVLPTEFIALQPPSPQRGP